VFEVASSAADVTVSFQTFDVSCMLSLRMTCDYCVESAKYLDVLSRVCGDKPCKQLVDLCDVYCVVWSQSLPRPGEVLLSVFCLFVCLFVFSLLPLLRVHYEKTIAAVVVKHTFNTDGR